MTEDSVCNPSLSREFEMKRSIQCLTAMLVGVAGNGWAAGVASTTAAPATALQQPVSPTVVEAERRGPTPAGNKGSAADRTVIHNPRVLDLLRQQDTLLYRSAFEVDLGSPEGNADLLLAAQGNAAAALRTGRVYCNRSIPQPQDVHRCIGWLQLASKLGNADAAYELALQFRRRGQPLLASNYEAQATGLGYVPPRSLDQVRK